MAFKPQICGSPEASQLLLAGQLVSESTLNPLECHRMLVQIFASQPRASNQISDNAQTARRPPAIDYELVLGQPTTQARRPKLARAKELLELQWSESDDSMALIGARSTSGQSGWKHCTCPVGDWKQTRRQRAPVTQGNINAPTKFKGQTNFSSDNSQMQQFGCKLTRKKLLKQLALGQILKRASRLANSSIERLHSVSAYGIETMLTEANQHLVELLRDLQLEDWHKSCNIIEQWSLNVCVNFGTELKNSNCQPYGHLIGIRLLRAGSRSRLAYRKWRKSGSGELASSSHDSGVLSTASEATFGSRSSEQLSSSFHLKFQSLDTLIKFRSSHQFRQIVGYSCDLFDRILQRNPLLSLEVVGQSCDLVNSLQKLKLLACVECQKLRAVLRFEWLLKCHWFAFQTRPSRWSGADDEENTSPLESRLPSILATSRYLDERVEKAYLRALNQLLGRLLRDHFLERALDDWITVVARRLREPSHEFATNHQPKLVVPVDLVERDDGQLAPSDPGVAIEQTLGFVVDELASISSDLPKQLKSGRQGFIEVLPRGDDLLEERRTKLADLLSGAKSQQMGETGWISRGYSRMISIVNKFRANDSLHEFDETTILNEHDGWHQIVSGSSKETELRSTCRQVKLLEHFEMLLKCRLERFSDFGQLIRLDFLQLNEKLAKIVEQERSLLIRVHSDDIFKLIESLRLQLDELELNIDLESAFEDYLSKRWQIKQSQQPDLEQKLLLDGSMDGELEMDESEPFHEGGKRRWLDKSVDQMSEATYGLARLKSGSTLAHEEEEEFANALFRKNNANTAHLLAMSNPNGVPLGEMLANSELGKGSRGLAPLVECRLLLARYEYLNNFVENELFEFLQNVQFFKNFGLMFLTEFLPTLPNTSLLEHHLEREQMDLISELGLRTRDLSPMLRDSFERLEMARQKLNHSNRSRSNVINRVCLEFDWLMQQLSSKRLNALRGTSEDLKNNIKHLDLIQATSTWAQKLRDRLEFLLSQNELLQKEARVLYSCEQYKFDSFEKLDELVANRVERDLELPPEWCGEYEIRAQIVSQWASFAQIAGSFWKLVDEFETQQVKWLNSDLKKLNYENVNQIFQESFSKRLIAMISDLKVKAANEMRHDIREKYSTLQINMMELNSSFDDFSQKLLPIFKFLTNRHLNQQHWFKLSELINSSPTGPQVGLSKLQLSTTVAQLLELGVQQFVDQLDEISRRATIEHELSSLILSETRRMDQLAQHSGCPSTKMQLESLEICSRLDEWGDEELILATCRFIQVKLGYELQTDLIDNQAQEVQINRLARQLVASHASIRRFLALSGHLNLITCSNKFIAERDHHQLGRQAGSENLIVLRTNTLLRSSQQVRASLLLEHLRLFTQTWSETSSRMGKRLDRFQRHLGELQNHLVDIEELLGRVRSLIRTELHNESHESERKLSQLQQNSIKLELEREILSTREALALEKQREVLKVRDECIRQITERVIPAIRASTKALDCLGDGRSLQTLRSYRPKPPLAIRLVVEAVCLLRNSCCPADARNQLTIDLSTPFRQALGNDRTQLKETRAHRSTPALNYPTSPQRHFDPLRGQIVEDYWPIACRTLNGLHSSKFISDLRLVSKRTIPRHISHLIRRKYLSRAEFQVESIERISPQTGLLARWVIAVDVFDRVINIVKPNYEQYLSVERSLGELLEDVTHKRQQINAIGQQLEQMNDQIGAQISRRVGLVDLIEDCSQQSQQIQRTKLELEAKRDELLETIKQLQQRMQGLARRCLWKTARLVYLDALPCDERRPVERILRALIKQLEFN